MVPLLVALLLCAPAYAAEALVTDRTHPSQVFRETRNFRIFLPPDYGDSAKRYPVIYWFHGYGERHNRPVAKGRNYDSGEDYGGDTIAAFVSKHDVIVVKWDGYNPRAKDEVYPRPYNISPVETHRQFPLYFPELVAYIDANFRTIPDRRRRATAGLSMGGFMSFWIAGKYPDLIGSASNFMGSSEFFVGPRGFDVEYRHEEMRGNYGGVRTRLVTGSRDFIQFYHRGMNAIWRYTQQHHETEDFDFDHGTPGMAKTLEFHMRAFIDPLPQPAEWSHADVYPSFSVWGWEVLSDRRTPGFTWLENVSKTGFRVSVREWLPAGAILPRVKLSIATASLYRPASPQVVTTLRLRDGQTRRTTLKADARGRLHFELDGEEQEVGIGGGGVLALAGYRLEGAEWASVRKPVRARVRIWNKGAAGSPAAPLRWETPNPNVSIPATGARLPALAPGASAEVPLAFTVLDENREIVQLYAVVGAHRWPVEFQLFPDAPPATDYRIADGRTFPVFQKAVEKQEIELGRGNGDGTANRGETLALLLPDGDAYRAAELFSADRCVDLTMRESDVWSSYDHVGASAKYSLAKIRSDCPAGHVIRLIGRVLLPDKPNHRVRYAVFELPVK